MDAPLIALAGMGEADTITVLWRIPLQLGFGQLVLLRLASNRISTLQDVSHGVNSSIDSDGTVSGLHTSNCHHGFNSGSILPPFTL